MRNKSRYLFVYLAASLIFGFPNITSGASIRIGDTELGIEASGKVINFDVGSSGNQVVDNISWFSINGSAPISIDTFDIIQNVMLTGNTWTSAIQLPGVLRIDFSGELMNDTDGDGNAGIWMDALHTNLSAGSLEISKYSYVDFDINGPLGDTAVFDSSSNLIRQTDSNGIGVNIAAALQYDFDLQVTDDEWLEAFDIYASGSTLEFGTQNRTPSFFEIGSFGSITDKLDTAKEQINLSNNTIPEPSTLMLTVIGLIGFARYKQLRSTLGFG